LAALFEHIVAQLPLSGIVPKNTHALVKGMVIWSQQLTPDVVTGFPVTPGKEPLVELHLVLPLTVLDPPMMVPRTLQAVALELRTVKFGTCPICPLHIVNQSVAGVSIHNIKLANAMFIANISAIE